MNQLRINNASIFILNSTQQKVSNIPPPHYLIPNLLPKNTELGFIMNSQMRFIPTPK